MSEKRNTDLNMDLTPELQKLKVERRRLNRGMPVHTHSHCVALQHVRRSVQCECMCAGLTSLY